MFPALDGLFAPTVREHQIGLPDSLEGLKYQIRQLHRAFPEYHLEIDEIIADGDKVRACMTCRGTNTGGFMRPPNGKSMEVLVFDVVRFQDGRIVEHWGAPDRFAVLAQLGLIPQFAH